MPTLTMTPHAIEESFKADMEAKGLTPPAEILTDGKLHRWSVSGKRGDKSGWYVFYEDGIPAGAFGCWRAGISETWCAKSVHTMSEAERAAHRQRMEAIRRQREEDEKQRQTKAAKWAQQIWNTAKPASNSHPYLQRKGVPAHKLRLYRGPLAIAGQPVDRALIVPLHAPEGGVCSLEFITAAGQKLLLPGGRKRGAAYPIGTIRTIICITEGWASGMSVWLATDYWVIIAFDAGNLEPVAKDLRAKYPTVKLVICADNDFHPDGKPNTGLLAAEQAAQAVNGILAVPTVLNHGPTDWNDVFVRQGLEAVRQGIETAMAPSKGSTVNEAFPDEHHHSPLNGDAMVEEEAKATEATPLESSDPPSETSASSFLAGEHGTSGAEASPPYTPPETAALLHTPTKAAPSAGMEVCTPETAAPAVPAHPHTLPALATSTNILKEFERDIEACGVVGEVRCAKLVYLIVTSRLLDEPVSVIVKGLSSSGKSYTVFSTVKFFPEDALITMTGMSEHALIYMPDEFSHRTLVIYEASALREQREKNDSNLTAYFLRSLLSEGRITYHVPVRDKQGGFVTKTITKEGPTNCIVTTTATELHGENETRMLSIPTNDSQDQTRAIMKKLAEGKSQTVDFTPWHALQDWLATQKKDVVIPFAPYLADKILPVAVRLRRDFRSLLRLIEAHAMLHQYTRERDSTGRIIAIAADYLAVRELVADLIADGVGATVSKTIRETVKVISEKDAGEGATVKMITDALKLDRSAVQRRIQTARGRGFIVNLEEKLGKPGRYAVGDPLPEEIELLPLSISEGVQHTPSGCSTSMHSLSNGNHDDMATPVQVCNENREVNIGESEGVIFDEA